MNGSDDLTNRKAKLSEARRALLLKRLQGNQQAAQKTGAISRQPEDGLLPLSYTQQRVWFLQQLFPDNRAYNMSEAWRVRGPLDIGALQQALQRVMQLHASLRTSFVAPDDEPMQRVAGEIDLQIPVSDLSELPLPAREEMIPQLVMAEGNHAFDLSQAPLFRPSIIRLGYEDHIVQLVLHHIITDEWSNDIIWREMNAFYAQALGLDDASLPVSEIHYTDYARWQREQVQTGALDAQMGYWKEQLSGELPLLQLPVDRPRGSQQSLHGGSVRRIFPSDLLDGLKALGQRSGVSLNMTLLAAFQALLYRYGGQEDILVGTPIANRQRGETKDVVGMFINTAVIRSTIDPGLNFGQLLAQVQQTVLDALTNQDLPFDLLVQALRPDRDLSYNPLFQTMFVFRADSVQRTLPGLEFEPVHVDRGVSKFDLTLFAGEKDGRLYSAIEYSGNLFDRATIERMLNHWQILLRSLVENPQAPINALQILDSDERELLLKKWNNAGLSLPESRGLHEIIGAQAVEQPSATAVIAPDQHLTYAQLNQRANQLANHLLSEGIKPRTPIGLFVERSSAMIVGILGILKAGGAYVPLDPAYPARRIAYILEDLEIKTIVTQEHLAENLPLGDATLIQLDPAYNALADAPASDPEVTISLDELAYIIYTSGSTGIPKGVMVSHRNLLASTAARWDYYEEPASRFLLLSSFAFDSSVAGIFWTLSTGGALVLPEQGDELDVLKLAATIQREGVTHTLALPSLYRLLLAHAPGSSLASLQVVIVAGEACPPDLGEIHYQLLPQTALYNEYGPTEATVWCSVYRLPRITSGSSPVPIGRPIANSHLYILDTRQQPVPIGVPGELYVGGAGVTPGYWNNAQQTEERFPTLAWPDGAVGPLYRTGDLARWLANGDIEFLGRADNQVKIRGFRIEPGEIEARLINHPQVHEAAVIVANGSQDSPQTKKLLAYVALDETGAGSPADSAALRSYLSDRLPEYMVPAHILFLPKLPHTPNGKLDPRQLPVPEIDSDRSLIPPHTPAEKILARIWCEILKLPEVSIEDKFFALGGDSIMSIQIIARARQEGLALTPRQMFEEQTIARLAAVAALASKDMTAPADEAGPLPLTPIQHWFYEQSPSNPAHWNQASWFEATTSLNKETLKTALGHVIQHHAMLRARFRADGRGWRQEIANETEEPVIELVSLSAGDRQDQDSAMIAEAGRLHARLDLANGPLLLGALFDLGSQRPPRLLLIIHHLVVDAVSWRIITDDLITAYQQISRGEPVVLPQPPASYSRWSRSLSSLARSQEMQREETYWLAQVVGGTSLPRDVYQDEPNTEGNSARLARSLSPALTKKLLADVHVAYHTRIDDILLAALARVLARWTASSHLLLTLERHGREEFDPRIDVSGTVGWFTALFPITLHLRDPGDPGADIRAIKEQLRAVPRNGAGFGVLRYLADEENRRKLAELPQPELLFNYLGQAGHGTPDDRPLRPLTAITGQAYGPQNNRAHLLDINAQVVDSHLIVNWQYATTHFQSATIQNLAEAYVSELGLLIEHCLQVERSRHTPSDFPLAILEQEDLDSLTDLLDELD